MENNLILAAKVAKPQKKILPYEHNIKYSWYCL
jgi:hypothetical protein